MFEVVCLFEGDAGFGAGMIGLATVFFFAVEVTAGFFETGFLIDRGCFDDFVAFAAGSGVVFETTTFFLE